MPGNSNSGRPRSSAEVRLARGAQSSKVNHLEPQLPKIDGEPVCPEFVLEEEEAKLEWDKNVRILQSMRILTEGDLGILANLCHSHAIMLKAIIDVRLNGLTIENKMSGMRAANPAVRIMNQQRLQIYQLSNQLGLTPSSRLRLQALPEGPKKNKFTALQEPATDHTDPAAHMGDFAPEDPDPTFTPVVPADRGRIRRTTGISKPN